MDIEIPPLPGSLAGGRALGVEELEVVVAALRACGSEHLIESVAKVALPVPTGYRLLCLQYVRPDKVGALYMPAQAQAEDVYQGRVGLVLRAGPDAYADATKFPDGPWCGVGDWIGWAALQGATTRLKYGKAVLSLIHDDQVLMRGVDPALASMSG
jgi:hypothetical protein